MTTKQQIQLEYDRKRIALKEAMKQAISDRDFNRRDAHDEIINVYREFRKNENELQKKRSKELTDLKMKHAEEYAKGNEVNRHLLNAKYRASKHTICISYDEELLELRRKRGNEVCKVRKDMRDQEKFYEEQVEDINLLMAEADERDIHHMEQLEKYDCEIQDAEEF